MYNITFRDITFESRYFSDPWWGRGEAISFTAIPRRPGAKLGTLRDITVKNVTGRAENSVRIWGSPEARARNILLDQVHITLDRWTKYKGGVYDNRPTSAIAPIEPHQTAGFSIQDADDVILRDCSVRWGANVPEYFCKPVESERVSGLKLERFQGDSARPGCADNGRG